MSQPRTRCSTQHLQGVECPGHIDLSGAPGRCAECSFHVATQGHRDCCSRTAAIAPECIWIDDFFENMRRRQQRLVAEKSALTEFDFVDNRRRRKAQDRSSPAAAVAGHGHATAAAGTNPAYVSAAVRSELERLAAAAQGTRNDTLNRVSFALFGLVKSGHINGPAVRVEMERIAASIGLSHSETQATLRSAWASASPRKVPAPRMSTSTDTAPGAT